MSLKFFNTLVMKLSSRGMLNRLPDRYYLKLMFSVRLGKKLNLNKPQTYNEKLQWLKLYDRKPEYTMMVDKYAVKQHVADKIGAEYINPTLGVYNNFDEIDFDKLPNQFVLKCTHDSGGLVICKDKLNLDLSYTRKKIEESLISNYYWHGREWPYKNVRPRILVEEYMVDESGYELKDYKFFCFNGVPKFLLVAKDREKGKEAKYDYFDENFNHLPFAKGHPNSEPPYFKPDGFEEMKALAEKLSKDIPHVRVDLYNINGKIYFGELTFYPASGFGGFQPEEWDHKIGEWLKLPKTNKE